MLEKGGVAPGSYERVAVGATPQRWEAVKAGQHAATMTIEPFTSIAAAQGFKVLAKSTETISDYQGGVFAARRSWAAQHPQAVQGFIKAYLETIMGNLQLSITNVHVRFEGELPGAGPAGGPARFAAGITLHELSAITTDASGSEAFEAKARAARSIAALGADA
jgi:hypothetical protein